MDHAESWPSKNYLADASGARQLADAASAGALRENRLILTRFEYAMTDLPTAALIPFNDGMTLKAFEGTDYRGERALMTAVLLDALSIFYKTHGIRDHRKRLEFREVHSWVFADGTDGPFSFENVCGAIGVDATALRDSLRRGQRMPKQRERYFRHVVAAPSAKAA